MMAMSEKAEEEEFQEIEAEETDGYGKTAEAGEPGEAAESAGEEPSEEGSEEASSEEDSRYAFPEAAVVRVMKRHLDKEKMIKKEVKVAMNQWLEKACTNIAKEMNKVPYVMVTLNEFRQGVKVYESLEEFDMEKQRILAHMEAIKKDIERLEKDLGKLTFNVDGVRN